MSRWIGVRCATCDTVLPVVSFLQWARERALTADQRHALDRFLGLHKPEGTGLRPTFARGCVIESIEIDWSTSTSSRGRVVCSAELEPGVRICGRPVVRGDRCEEHDEGEDEDLAELDADLDGFTREASA